MRKELCRYIYILNLVKHISLSNLDILYFTFLSDGFIYENRLQMIEICKTLWNFKG